MKLLFRRASRLMLFLLILLIVVSVFIGRYNTVLGELGDNLIVKAETVRRYVDLSIGFIDLLTVHSTNYLRHGDIADEPTLELITYDGQTDSYNLDAIQDTFFITLAGNLTGIGPVPDTGKERDELNLALELGPHFVSVYKNLPEAAWIYYTSANGFIHLYPFTRSDEFAYFPGMTDEVFYTEVTPEKNPLRSPVWTPVYVDHAGKGLMVTLSNPVYDDNKFIGVISIDLTNEFLSQQLSSSICTYLSDSGNNLIAYSEFSNEDEVQSLASVIGCGSEKIDELKALKDNTVTRVGTCYFAKRSFTNAPWTLFVHMPVASVVGKALLGTLPLALICILLFFAFVEIDNRKKAEYMLKSSLDELTSYKNILENAAKYDFLTSSVNRRGLMDILGEIKASTKPPLMSLIMCDIDRFKLFNDTYGHSAGDFVLVEIARIMRSLIKPGEAVCRWGGEEFLILLLDREYEETLSLAEKIRKQIESLEIPWDRGEVLRATISMGVCEYDAKTEFHNAVATADAALYAAKSAGRNRVRGSREL